MPWHSPSFISINTLYLLNCGRNTSGSILTTTTALPSSVSTTIRIALARIASSLHRFFVKLAHTDLLILDDFSMKVLDDQQLLDFMEIIEDRRYHNHLSVSSSWLVWRDEGKHHCRWCNPRPIGTHKCALRTERSLFKSKKQSKMYRIREKWTNFASPIG